MANIKKINDRWRIFFSFTLNKKEFIQREYSTKVVLALFTGTLTVFAIPIIIGWISGLYDPQDVVLVVSMSLFGGYGLWLCSRSRWQIASFIPPILTLLLAAYLTFLSGFLTTGLLIYPISILLSAVLQGKKQQWIMTGISFCIYLVVSLNRHPESYEYLVETILMVGGGFMGIALLNDFISNEWAKSHARLRDEAAEHLRSKQKLEKSEQQYRLLFENNLAGVYISSLDGQLISCNQAFANIFGFESPNEVIGQFVFNFYQDPKDREKFIALLTKHGYTKNIESRLLHKDGRIIWGIENSNLSEDPNNGGMIIHGTIIDITDLKEEQRLQDALRLIVLSTTRASDIDDLYREIHKIIREVMIADNFYIALYDEDDDLLRFPYLMDEGEDSVEPYKPDQGMTEYVLRNGKPLLCEIPLQEEIADQGEFEFVGASPQIWLGVPLTMEDNVIGVIAVQHYTDPKAYSL
nr:PAS domain S-box protein [Chloroflexota bacterium]